MNNPKAILKKTFYSKNRKKEINFERIFLELINAPAFKYLSIGLTAAILARIAKNVKNDYPEVSEFINQNLGLFEEKLNNLKSMIHTNDISQKI